ncbi:ABC transporter permease [Pseudoflavonifractor sp. 524-17]|uniref:ABC transporter permease n=1 Tax=Pseudoflavonifractor sp. 524-17 TaxID=2304577 RepID=UPI00137AF611|nr:ABC transporter permease [Pseudoflavonifractor sp. 524-17]NCE66477.1 ABC transporter permease [Pseudoflavonifractor sp. 524-17]
MDILGIFLTADFYSATIRLMTPLMLAALGGVICERTGVLNMALEGQMLMGAFFAYLGAYLFNNAWLGLLVAMAGGMFLAAIHAFMSITVKVNQTVVALGLNTLAMGITSTIFRLMFGTDSQMAHCPGFTAINLPVLSDIPFLGPVLFRQYPLTYIAIAALLGIHWFLFHSSRGLELRAAGENPQALDVAGVDVIRIRWAAVLVSGAFCGLAGASLTLNGLNTFYDNISSGRGFIAYAAVVFGKWAPLGATLATVLFGAGDALQLRMQAMNFNIPYYFYLMMPYLITFLALVFFMGPSKGPAATNVPFVKDKARKRTPRHKQGGN